MYFSPDAAENIFLLVLWKEFIFILLIPLFIEFHLYYPFSSAVWFGNLRSQAPPLEVDWQG